MLSFEKSSANRRANAFKLKTDTVNTIPTALLRQDRAHFPELSELQVVRHFTQLSQKNFSIDTQFYPLGSCTMKYNPRAAHQLATLPQFFHHHPLAPEHDSQGALACLYDLQQTILAVTGMAKVSLAPMAGAQGEFAGVAMIKAYHLERGDTERTEILVPDAAHGTNPASAVKCGFKVREIPTTSDGDVDMEALAKALGPKTAGIMLTNPSTYGVFERQIKKIAAMVHEAGGLLYYDGANLNAILGKYRPGDMGFDVLHMNLHKTFATPHGGGGPGAGPVAANAKLAKYLPVPMVAKNENGFYLEQQSHCPASIGYLNTFMGNAGVLFRAYVYGAMLGREGLPRVAEMATLNANYLMKRLQAVGYTLAFPKRRASHEFLLTVKDLKIKYGVRALDIAKRLLDYGYHAPTIYFPINVPECLLIEPTETESKETLDRFVEAMEKILEEVKTNPELVKTAPHSCAVKRLDEVKAARELNLRWRQKINTAHAEAVR